MDIYKPITVTLGDTAEIADRHLRSGRYASLSEVLCAGIEALDREDAASRGAEPQSEE